MNDTDDESSPYNSGLLTPPLSPTKTISTEHWSSPRTPRSPRQSRSCLFFQDIDHGIESPFLKTSSSPTKPRFAFRLNALSIPEMLSAPHDPVSPQSDDDSPIKRHIQNANQSPSAPSPTLARSHVRFLPGTGGGFDGQITTPTDVTSSPVPAQDIFTSRKQSHYRSISESFTSELDPCFFPTTISLNTAAASIERLNSQSPVYTNPTLENFCSPSKLHRLAPRHASSPLRPSQRPTCNGFLPSPRQGQAGTPDRFIAYRRPPSATRESFELNKPAERLEAQRMVYSGIRSAKDPFGHQLRRSGRLNNELRGLQEAHSLVTGRATANRRNSSLAFRRDYLTLGPRQVSTGAVWNVGGPSAVSDTVVGVSTGRGGILGSGTNAPLYRSTFFNRADPEAELEAYERRLALALDVDQTDRILQHSPTSPRPHNGRNGNAASHAKHMWRDGAWAKDSVHSLLDAPQLRDDYYCTLLAYSHTTKCLAVGLGNFVHLWSERNGVDTPESLNSIHITSTPEAQHVTSLDFSSTQGGQAILAVGRANGRIALWSPFDSEPRFDATQPEAISCVSWRPSTVQRPSVRDKAMTVATEELLVGDEVGNLYFYSIEWPSETQSALFDWRGAMTLLARMTIHTQQICGLAWSVDGEQFASGGNDNNCLLFETKKVLRLSNSSEHSLPPLGVREGPNGESIYTVTNRACPTLDLSASTAKHRWTLNAAVKAMAFCPWQRGLIAIGGGSNDRCIHFYHTRSSTCLATIDCAAQVTSLIWSQTRCEIAATFGFAQPEHPYRIAVFAWPSCEQVVAVPWWDENRALCAVAYPGSPTSGPDMDVGGRAKGEDGVWSRRGVEEGCIVVAASDMAIRFHEIWTDKKGGAGRRLLADGMKGLLGGSVILEGLHGIEHEGAVIR